MMWYLSSNKPTLVQVMATGNNKQQVNTWANVDPDLYYHMVSLGHNELTRRVQETHISIKKSKRQQYRMTTQNEMTSEKWSDKKNSCMPQ